MHRTRRTRTRVQPPHPSEGMTVRMQDSSPGQRHGMSISGGRRTRKLYSKSRTLQRLVLMIVVVCGIAVFWPESQPEESFEDQLELVLQEIDQAVDNKWPPLVMEGGDPYIRALMRTISASESNSTQPYHILYGGRYLSDLSEHPDRCVTIVNGPNKGLCTTAAGRYQILTETWERISYRYHPQSSQFWFHKPYNFEAKYQDVVIYHWLKDTEFWEMDIPQMLRQGKLNEVLRLLSATWTSLGYGIEDNVMTRYLPGIYEEILQRELNALEEAEATETQPAVESVPKEED